MQQVPQSMVTISIAAEEVEFLVEEMIDGNVSTLNPFLFRHFWMGVTTRWPEVEILGFW